jgi:hypothetical protein
MKIYSGTKSILERRGTCRQEDGVLDLDERRPATVQDWTGDPKKGTDHPAPVAHLSRPAYRETYSLHNDGWADRDAHALKQPLVAQPGNSFILRTGGTAGLSRSVAPENSRRVGRTTTRYLERRVLKASRPGSSAIPRGQGRKSLLATGFRMTANQWSTWVG